MLEKFYISFENDKKIEKDKKWNTEILKNSM